MTRSKLFGKILNPIVNTVLRSPLHPLMSEHSVVLDCTDRKSGNTRSFPAYYYRMGRKIFILVEKSTEGWRNLRDGANVKLTVKGKHESGWAESVSTEKEINTHLYTLLEMIPELESELDLTRDVKGDFADKDIKALHDQYGIVKIKVAGV